MESLSENQNYASEAEAFLNLKQHLQLDECMSAKSRYVEDLTGTDFKFKEEFYYTSVYHTLKNGLKINQVCVQYHIPGHRLYDGGPISRPHFHVRAAPDWVVLYSNDPNNKFISQSIKDHYYTSLPTLKKVKLSDRVEAGWRILELSEAKDLRQQIIPFMDEWSIVAFKTGKFDGHGYGYKFSETHGAECGEMMVVRVSG